MPMLKFEPIDGAKAQYAGLQTLNSRVDFSFSEGSVLHIF